MCRRIRKVGLLELPGFIYDFKVYKIIKGLKPSQRGELEITDVNNTYINNREMSFDILEGWWTDAGTFESLFRASCLIAEKERRKSE